MRNSRQIAFAIMPWIMAITISGCCEAPAPVTENEIVLLEPVNDTSAWEEAACRTLYNAKVYAATVFPATEEYSFGKDVVFDRFTVYPGESVRKGSVLAYADTSALEESIRKKEEQILEMEETFAEYLEEAKEAIYEQEQEVEYLRTIVENLESEVPEEYLPVKKSENTDQKETTQGNGSAPAGNTSKREKNPEYLKWKEQYIRYEGDYRILAHNADIARTQMEQRVQLYELEHAFVLKQLEKMKSELKLGTLKSSMKGSVAGFSLGEKGSYVSGKDPVIAIGDMEHKLLKCQYINKATAANAEDIYALVDGRRYEIVYQPMDSEEYTRRSASGETIYSAFELAEPAEEISVGDFAVITVINDIRENVLSVPVSALHKDSAGSFVYVKEGDGSTAVTVETGMSDGAYTEILSGIKEGDRVLVSEAPAGEGRTVVEKGSFHSNFRGSGYLTYLSSVRVFNPITYGKVYFVEYVTALYEHVEKGQVIARIHVQPDEVALKRNQVRLERLTQRLADLEKGIEDASEAEKKSIEKTIAAQKKEIEELRELVDRMSADYAATEIKAGQDGIIIGIRNYQPEDILAEGAELVEIAREDTCYVAVENKNQLLSYGSQVTVSYKDKEGNPCTAQGMVANLSEAGVESSLRSNISLIRLSKETIGQMAAAAESPGGRLTWVSIQVEAVIREMNDVCVVPKEAVWEMGGRTYVLVAEEDGRIVARSFVAGGYDSAGYWVVEGLTEGVEICLKKK